MMVVSNYKFNAHDAPLTLATTAATKIAKRFPEID
jgi:hypothetical protein